MTMRDKVEIELVKTRVRLHWLRKQVMLHEVDLLRLMKRLDIDFNDKGDLPRPIHCTSCGFKMIDEDELCAIAGQWTCSECYSAFILEVDGIDLSTEEGMKQYKELYADDES